MPAVAADWALVTACWHWLETLLLPTFEEDAFASPSLSTMITFWALGEPLDVRAAQVAFIASAK